MAQDYTINSLQQSKPLPNIIFIVGIVLFAVALMNGTVFKMPDILETLSFWAGMIAIVLGAFVELMRRM